LRKKNNDPKRNQKNFGTSQKGLICATTSRENQNLQRLDRRVFAGFSLWICSRREDTKNITPHLNQS
ncbi:MAG: hypothetical protein FWF88_09900, partial [Peptococcaceae bacterium]|nr:hypothetical protein [Peptococcaceae bacterium]